MAPQVDEGAALHAGLAKAVPGLLQPAPGVAHQVGVGFVLLQGGVHAL